MNRGAAALLTIGLVVTYVGPTSAVGRPASSVHATYAATASPASVTGSPAPCTDTKYNLFGVHWTTSLHWYFKSSTTPSYLNAAGVVAVLKRGFTNITQERNDCGRTDHVSAAQAYLGTTTRAMGVTKAGMCAAPDTYNTVGFGQVPAGALALTCVRSLGSRITEIDIRLTNQRQWALSLIGCLNAYMLESVITHEAGHAFGLDHVSEVKHGRLTMSTFIDSTCENQEATLGKGDMNGLEAMY